jgi:hypothetical protein
MPKVYIAAAFRSASARDPRETDKVYGTVVDSNYINFLESVEDVFLRFGYDTCLPHRDEGMWGRAYFNPADISAVCFRHIETSDVIFGIAEGGRGVHIEFGYAARAGKRLILAYRAGKEPSTLIWGFPRDLSPWHLGFGGETDTVIFEYKDQADLIAKLEEKLTDRGERSISRVWKRTISGIIDIGSHTLKLRVFRHGKGTLPGILYEAKESIGIISSVTSTGRIDESSITCMTGVLRRFLGICTEHNCDRVIAVGTAALRKAANSAEVLDTIKNELGLRVQLLTPDIELDYVYGAVRRTIQAKEPIAVLNLGGGSTQIGVGTNDFIQHRFLLPIGTRHITEKWPWKDGFNRDAYEEMRKFANHAVIKIIDKPIPGCRFIVHTGGELDFLLHCRVPLELCRESPKHVSQISVSDSIHANEGI